MLYKDKALILRCNIYNVKTIIITSFHQFISRNILLTPILDGLIKTPDTRVVIIAPKDKKEYFDREFGSKEVAIEYIPTSRTANGFWSLLFKRSAQAMAGFRYKEIARGFLKNTGRDFLLTVFFRYPLLVVGKFKAIHTAMRFLNYHLVRRGDVAHILARYNPDLLFSTDAQNENDVILMTEAKRKKIRVISMIRSWDNAEMYGVLRIIPEALLVWGDFVKNSILRLNAMDPTHVIPVGVPHYDRYLAGPTMSRKEFCESLGVDPLRKIIFFTPVGDMYLKENDVDPYILAELSKLDATILVRMPPADTVSWGNFVPPSNVVFYRPGRGGKGKGRSEISREDDDHLINSLYYSDLVISGPSTIMLDAALLDKPVLLFGFEKNKKEHKDSVESLYDSRHLQVMIESKAARFAKTVEEFRKEIREFLENPHKDASGRKHAVEFVCYKTDGKSSERILEVIKSAMNKQ